jgi:hypothetical protein
MSLTRENVLYLGVLADHKSNIETLLIEEATGDQAKAIENYFMAFLLTLSDEKPHADVFLSWIVERWRGHGTR